MFFRSISFISITFVNLLLVNACTTTADPQSVTIVRNETKVFGKEATYTSHGMAQNQMQQQQQYSNDNNEIIQEDSSEIKEQNDEKEHNPAMILSGAGAAGAASEHANTSSKNLVKGEEDFDIKSMGKESKDVSKSSKTGDVNQSNLAGNSKLSEGAGAADAQQPVTAFKTSTPLNSPDFAWPIKGNVIKHYSKKVGMQNEGINIAAPLNAPVSAAGDGTVVYTGSSDKYGNLIIIKHKDSYFSAYSHLNEIDVKSAQNVVKGDIIGKVGSTGEVDKPQLYFSMRKNKITIDPELMR